MEGRSADIFKVVFSVQKILESDLLGIESFKKCSMWYSLSEGIKALCTMT
jgi:hypothetical protein